MGSMPVNIRKIKAPAKMSVIPYKNISIRCFFGKRFALLVYFVTTHTCAL